MKLSERKINDNRKEVIIYGSHYSCGCSNNFLYYFPETTNSMEVMDEQMKKNLKGFKVKSFA